MCRSDTTEVVSRYYANDAVRNRMVEFLGGPPSDPAGGEYILAFNHETVPLVEPRHPADLPECMAHGCDITRSLWDRNRLVVHVDIEYVNFDFLVKPISILIARFKCNSPS